MTYDLRDLHGHKTVQCFQGCVYVLIRLEVIVLRAKGDKVSVAVRQCAIAKSIDEIVVRIAYSCPRPKIYIGGFCVYFDALVYVLDLESGLLFGRNGWVKGDGIQDV